MKRSVREDVGRNSNGKQGSQNSQVHAIVLQRELEVIAHRIARHEKRVHSNAIQK